MTQAGRPVAGLIMHHQQGDHIWSDEKAELFAWDIA